MKLLILTTEPNNFVPQTFKKKAEAAGWEVELINPDKAYINVSVDPYISFDGTKFLGADACIPRLSESHMDYKDAMMEQLEHMGVNMLNSAESMVLASNKLKTQIVLNKNGIVTPASAMIGTVDQLENAFKSIGGEFPVILKTLSGTHGVGVMRADSMPSLMGVVQQLHKSNTNFMLQKYYPHEQSKRLLMLDGVPVAGVSRSVPKGDFRTNAHQGAELVPFDPDEKEIEACKRVCELIGTRLGAVDYLIDEEGNVIVFEINGSPGFEAMQKALETAGKEVDVAQLIVDGFLASTKEVKPEEKADEPAEKPAEEPAEASPEATEEKVKEESVEIVAEDEGDEAEATKDDDKEPAASTDTVVDYDDDKDEEATEVVEIGTPDKAIVKDSEGNDTEISVIGSVTDFVIKRFNDNKPIEARVDTGAAHSSINADTIDIKDNTVSFTYDGTRYRCHLVRTSNTKSASGGLDNRPVVKFDIQINGSVVNNVEFTLTNRTHMRYDVLLGRSALSAAGILINPAAGRIAPD